MSTVPLADSPLRHNLLYFVLFIYIVSCMLQAELEDRAFKALGHRDRRTILRILSGGERPVGHLADETDLQQPVVSQHLRVLRTAGLVVVRGDGNRRLYSVDFARFAEMRRFLDDFWTDKLGALKRVAEGKDL